MVALVKQTPEGFPYPAEPNRGAGSQAAPCGTNSATPSSVTGGPDSANPQPASSGPENRRSARYYCEGKAEIHKAGSDSTWGVLKNVSLHGCFIETKATYPTATDLQVKLHANGVDVEVRGKVVWTSGVAMGITYVDLSEADRARLKQLWTKPQRPS